MSELVYTLLEFCHVAKIDEQLVMEFVEHGILETELGQDQWLFRSDALSRCLRAERMRQDLQLDLHGVALALQLIERNQKLRHRIDYLEQLIERLRH
jgi:chaperone modulatory protein CbpM